MSVQLGPGYLKYVSVQDKLLELVSVSLLYLRAGRPLGRIPSEVMDKEAIPNEINIEWDSR